MFNFLKSASFVVSLALVASCSNAPKGDKAAVTDQQQTAAATGSTYAIDTTTSALRFTGNGVGKNHPGTLRLSGGTLAIADNTITGGQFTININSMQVEEQGDMFQNKLKPHLLGADFFDAEKNPTAKFEITKVEPYAATAEDSSVVAGANHTVSGNLTLKGATKNVTFPAKIEINNDALSAKANFDINRTHWGMKYGNDKSLGDKFISETVNIQLNIQAKK